MKKINGGVAFTVVLFKTPSICHNFDLHLCPWTSSWLWHDHVDSHAPMMAVSSHCLRMIILSLRPASHLLSPSLLLLWPWPWSQSCPRPCPCRKRTTFCIPCSTLCWALDSPRILTKNPVSVLDPAFPTSPRRHWYYWCAGHTSRPDG